MYLHGTACLAGKQDMHLTALTRPRHTNTYRESERGKDRYLPLQLQRGEVGGWCSCSPVSPEEGGGQVSLHDHLRGVRGIRSGWGCVCGDGGEGIGGQRKRVMPGLWQYHCIVKGMVYDSKSEKNTGACTPLQESGIQG